MRDLKTTWTINGLLLAILVLLGAQFSQRIVNSASAAGGGWDTDGVMINTVTGPNDRLVLVDTKNQNIMLYNARQGGSFGLIGARNYKYDVELEDTEGKIKGNGLTYAETKLAYEAKKP